MLEEFLIIFEKVPGASLVHVPAVRLREMLGYLAEFKENKKEFEYIW